MTQGPDDLARQPEIQVADVAFAVDQDVGHRDVAMLDIAAVQDLQPAQHLFPQFDSAGGSRPCFWQYSSIGWPRMNSMTINGWAPVRATRRRR